MLMVMAAGGVEKEREKRSTSAAGHARRLDARERVLQTAHGRLRTQRAATLRCPAHGQLEQGIRAQGVAVVGVLVSARDREHAEAQHRRESVDHRRRHAPLPNAARQRLGQTEPAFRLAQQDQAAVRRDQPAINRRSPSCG